ncbi:MAG: 16S rRNA (uracil(1498)-N(3))-methyltransferase [Gammaproteobacteria bacterium]|nr:16S rRNA (uracil(1498)-N(3))-methyltransferase [Gammaproteobacteria bacterium]
MRISRIFQDQTLALSKVVQLDQEASHYVKRVLRMQMGDPLIIFNGKGGEYAAVIVACQDKQVKVQLNEFFEDKTASPLMITLAQAVSRGEKMDYTLQKAVELGVHRIVPLMTERVGVKLEAERAKTRLQHWQKIVVSACEQSGRTKVPTIEPLCELSAWLKTAEADLKLLLDPHTQTNFSPDLHPKHVALLIGPEGGLSAREVELAYEANFIPWHLGPRVLRTETAGIAAVSVLQYVWGDLGIKNKSHCARNSRAV